MQIRYLGVLLCLACVVSGTGAGNVGVNYGTLGNDLPPPSQVAKLLLSTSLRNVKLYNADQATLQAFANTDIKVVVGVANDAIPLLASSPTGAQAWVEANVAAYMPATQISAISVGNEVLTVSPELGGQLVPAMSNIHTALVNLKLDGQVKVSSPHNLAILAKSYPPSVGTFKSNLEGTLGPLVTFLSETGSPFMINAYPFFAYVEEPQNVSLNYVMFHPEAGVTDANTGLHYTNMLDAQIDAVFSAIQRLGHHDVQLVVSETGWPSSGDATQMGCDVSNAQTYNGNLIKHITSNQGTPLRPGASIDVYIFALFNENLKPGPSSERNFGLFNPDESVVYDVGLVQTSGSPGPPSTSYPPPAASPPTTPPQAAYPPTSPVTPAPSATPSPESPALPTPPYYPPESSPPTTAPVPEVSPPPPAPEAVSPTPPPAPPAEIPPAPYLANPGPVQNPSTSGKTWCVAKPGAPMTDMINALSFACGEGAADCSAIQTGQNCFSPNTLYSHASYAFNAYYQKNGRNYWNCYFGNTGVITITDPSYSGCAFP